MDTVSDDATMRPAPRPEPERPRSGSTGILAVFLGGVVAGGIGYLAAYYTEFGLFQTDDGTDPLAAISATLEDQAQRLGTLEERADAAPVAGPDAELQGQLGEVAERIAAISERIDTIESAPGTDPEAREQAEAASASLGTLQERLAALEEQTGNPGVTETDASQSQQLAELDRRLAELSQEIQSQSQVIEDQAAQLQSQEQTIDQQRGEIEEARNAARSETNRISAQAALAEIRAAMDAGTPYADAIGQLRSTGEVEVPEALAGPAGSGVATISALQQSYPEAARSALSASVAATAGGGPIDRFGAFLKAQTGARALDEQEGTGPDAVLSRAEARLREGELEAALSELDALPQEGRDAMSDWIDRARARLDARQALAGLSQSVNNI